MIVSNNTNPKPQTTAAPIGRSTFAVTSKLATLAMVAVTQQMIIRARNVSAR